MYTYVCMYACMYVSMYECTCAGKGLYIIIIVFKLITIVNSN